MICDRCYRPQDVGDHGVGLCPLEPRRQHVVVGDDIPGGEVVKHCPGLHGQTFYTKSAIRDAAAALGWENRVYWTGEHEQHVQRMVAVDLTDYDDPAVIEARQRAMAEHCGMTLDEYLAIRAQRVRCVGSAGDEALDMAILDALDRVEAGR